MARVIAIMGPIGAGKTEQGKRVAERFRMVNFSIGQLIREDTHKEAHAAMHRGDVAPTEYVQELVLRKFSQIPSDKNVIFDGPLMVGEAERYQRELPRFGHELALVVVLEVDESEVERRLTKRYQAHGRPDDHPDTVHNRWKRYHEITLPVLEFYKQQAIPVVRVDGNVSASEVTDLIAEVLREQGIIEPSKR